MTYPTAPSDAESQQWFAKYDRGQKGHLTIDEIQALLNERGRPLWAPFDQETRPLVLTQQGFVGLWQYLCQWHGIFMNFDADRSGNISISELQNALDCFGFRLPPRLIQLMIHKQRLSQGKIQKGRQLPNEVDFPAFIDLCVTVKQATDMFTRLDTNRSGSVQLYWENYMDLIVGGK
ncbi:hypothetical protein NQZ79_g3727 [Umbelopsis isabellina]|nr:hypothetical protein NQZ79_g3727 [Umbelopsis isabellina]